MNGDEVLGDEVRDRERQMDGNERTVREENTHRGTGTKGKDA